MFLFAKAGRSAGRLTNSNLAHESYRSRHSHESKHGGDTLTAEAKIAHTETDRSCSSYAFFLSAHRAFINSDNFLRDAALMGLRPAAFFWAGVVFFPPACPFCFAHRALCAAEILARAAALILRGPRRPAGAAGVTFRGRPRRGAGWPSRRRAASACSMRLSSCLSCATMLVVSMLSFRNTT